MLGWRQGRDGVGAVAAAGEKMDGWGGDKAGTALDGAAAGEGWHAGVETRPGRPCYVGCRWGELDGAGVNGGGSGFVLARHGHPSL
jgi:hypothetical protein